MERVTYVGAGFLAIIAVIPSIVAKQMAIPFFVASFLGGTGLLIVVSVGLDLMQRVEANLLMRNYSGFLSGGEQGSSGRPRFEEGARRSNGVPLRTGGWSGILPGFLPLLRGGSRPGRADPAPHHALGGWGDEQRPPHGSGKGQ